MNSLWKNQAFCQALLPGAELTAGDMARAMGSIRRRRNRVRAIALPAAILVMACTLTLWNSRRPPQAVASDPSWKISTRPFDAIIASRPEPNLVVRTSLESASIAVVRTDPHGFQEISDEDLLRSFPGRALAILRDGGRAVLEFLDTSAQ